MSSKVVDSPENQPLIQQRESEYHDLRGGDKGDYVLPLGHDRGDVPESPQTSSTNHCDVCNQTIEIVSQKHFKPCACDRLVHIACAKKDTRWVNRKCLRCGQLHFKIQEPSPKGTSKPQLTHKDGRMCIVCRNARYQNVNAPRHDSRYLKPCFCEVYSHHGCMVDIVLHQNHCRLCGVDYQFYSYGSTKDYFVRYACQYLIFAIVFSGIASLAGFAVVTALATAGSFSLARWMLLVIGSALSFGAVAAALVCIRHTVVTRLPRFRKRYGQVTILEYEPQPRKHKKPSRFDLPSADSDVPLHQQGDISLGQYLFGHKNSGSWRHSSTPLAAVGQQVKFSFDTPPKTFGSPQ